MICSLLAEPCQNRVIGRIVRREDPESCGQADTSSELTNLPPGNNSFKPNIFSKGDRHASSGPDCQDHRHIQASLVDPILASFFSVSYFRRGFVSDHPVASSFSRQGLLGRLSVIWLDATALFIWTSITSRFEPFLPFDLRNSRPSPNSKNHAILRTLIHR